MQDKELESCWNLKPACAGEDGSYMTLYADFGLTKILYYRESLAWVTRY